MEIGFSELLYNNDELAKPKGTIKKSGKAKYPGLDLLKEGLGEQGFKKIIVRYNHDGGYYFGGISEKSKSGKIVVAITRIEENGAENFKVLNCSSDKIQSKIKEKSWNLRQEDFKDVTSMPIDKANKKIIEWVKSETL